MKFGETGSPGTIVDEPIRLLICDDDELCREILRDAIQEERVEISLASDGVDALEKLEAESFDILIIDLNMPRMDGLTLFSIVHKRQPEILAIIISGYGSLDAAIEAIHQGAYDYIQKPFKIEEIIAPVKNAVERVRLSRENAALRMELHTVYGKLQRIESEMHEWRNQEDARLPAGESPLSSYLLFERNTVPVFDTPQVDKDPDNVLVALERLRELRKAQIINEDELQRLKKMFLGNTESGAT